MLSWRSPGRPSGRPPRCRGPAREHPAWHPPGLVVGGQERGEVELVDEIADEGRQAGRIDPVMQAGRHQQEAALVARAERLRAHTDSHPGRAPGWRLPTRAPIGPSVPAADRRERDLRQRVARCLRVGIPPASSATLSGRDREEWSTAITITRLAAGGASVPRDAPSDGIVWDRRNRPTRESHVGDRPRCSLHRH